MTKYYSKEYKQDVIKQRKKVLSIYLIILSIFILFSAGMIFWFSTLTYKSNTVVLIKIIHYSVSFIFVLFSFFYVGIKLRRLSKFIKLCNQIEAGIMQKNQATFYEYSESMQDNMGVDCKALVFLEWNKYKKDYYERKVLVFYELPFPELIPNKKYNFNTKGNVLIEYEEVEDDE